MQDAYFPSLVGGVYLGIVENAWLSGGLIWTIDAADDGQKASPDDHHAEAPSLIVLSRAST